MTLFDAPSALDAPTADLPRDLLTFSAATADPAPKASSGPTCGDRQDRTGLICTADPFHATAGFPHAAHDSRGRVLKTWSSRDVC